GLVVPLHSDLRPIRGNQTAENGVAVAQITIHRVGEVEMSIRSRLEAPSVAAVVLQNHQPIHIFYRKAAQQCLIEQTENRRIRTDAKRESKNRNRRKPR